MDGDEASTAAPVFKVPERQIIAIEHPMIVQDIENGIKTFGRNRPFQRIIDSRDAQDIIPLYLRYDDPMCTPILSHNSATNNLLLKITVPKRIGRKRKRGSQDALQNDWEPLEDDEYSGRVHSHSRIDKPASLLRKLQDTKGRYTVEVAGEITQSHRFRGVSDFQHSVSNTDFMPKFRNIVDETDVDKLREFKFDPQRGWKPNEQFFPAPITSSHTIPFNWGWHQNPATLKQVDEATGEAKLVNRQGGKKINLMYLNQDVESVPMRPTQSPSNEPGLLELIAQLKQALEERPIYTRRALVNRVGSSKELWLFKDAVQYVGYQFRGGPFRDAVIKFGVDPRSDPKYRPYQTFFFKLFEEEEKIEGMQWKDVRTSYVISKKGATKEDRESHIFDGKNLILDGKIWQACDITDPLLAKLLKEAPVRQTCDNVSDGWYPEGSMAKIRAVMKAKLMAVCSNKQLADKEFEAALRVPDFWPGKKSKGIIVPVPKVELTEQEIEEMKKRGLTKAVQSNAIRKNGIKGKARNARIRKKIAPKTYKEKSISITPAPAPAPTLAPRPVVEKTPSTAPAAWNIPVDPIVGKVNLSTSDRPLTSIETEAAEGTSRVVANGDKETDEIGIEGEAEIEEIEDDNDIDIEEIEDEDEGEDDPENSDDEEENEKEEEGEESDIENNHISEGGAAASDHDIDADSDETDVVDYKVMYGPRREGEQPQSSPA